MGSVIITTSNPINVPAMLSTSGYVTSHRRADMYTITYKRCSKCGEWRSPESFYKDKRTRDGLFSACKNCHADSVKRYIESNHEQHIARQKAYFSNPEILEKKHKRDRAWKKNNPVAVRIYNNKRRSLKKNSSGSFSEDEWKEIKIKYNYTCLSCGKREPEIKLTIDHVTPLSMGGSNTVDNIQPLCGLCNCRKHAKRLDYRTAWRTH